MRFNLSPSSVGKRPSSAGMPSQRQPAATAAPSDRSGRTVARQAVEALERQQTRNCDAAKAVWDRALKRMKGTCGASSPRPDRASSKSVWDRALKRLRS